MGIRGRAMECCCLPCCKEACLDGCATGLPPIGSPFHGLHNKRLAAQYDISGSIAGEAGTNCGQCNATIGPAIGFCNCDPHIGECDREWLVEQGKEPKNFESVFCFESIFLACGGPFVGMGMSVSAAILQAFDLSWNVVGVVQAICPTLGCGRRIGITPLVGVGPTSYPVCADIDVTISLSTHGTEFCDQVGGFYCFPPTQMRVTCFWVPML